MATVLVVEDNPDERQICSAVLYYNGFDVIEASTGEAALELARKHHPAVIIMDVRLPGLDGLLVSEILTSSDDTSQIPIVCVTAYDVDRGRAETAGLKGVLRKPVPPEVLVKKVRTLADNSGPQTPPQSQLAPLPSS